MDCVVDAGALLELLLRGPRASAVEEALDGRGMVAPTHLDVEVLTVLRQLERDNQLSSSRAEAVLADFYAAPLERYSVLTLMRDAWALRHVLSAYEACYVALAERLACPLITTDHRIIRAQLRIQVIAI